MLGAFAIAVSRLIGTCIYICSLFKTRHNRYPLRPFLEVELCNGSTHIGETGAGVTDTSLELYRSTTHIGETGTGVTDTSLELYRSATHIGETGAGVNQQGS